jgi:hypothetical protein
MDKRLAQARAYLEARSDQAATVLVESVAPPPVAFASPEAIEIESYLADVSNGPGNDDGLDIPASLKREPKPKQERLAAKPEVFEAAKRIASGNGTKSDKDKVRIEKLKAAKTVKEAELTGKRRKMPLTGKAALDAIRAKR